MRISDWSSDVCSSDLQERLTGIDRALLRDANAAGWLEAGGKDVFDRAIRIGRLRKLERLGLAAPAGRQHWQLAPDLEAALRQKIGRASCRERVCQYV